MHSTLTLYTVALVLLFSLATTVAHLWLSPRAFSLADESPKKANVLAALGLLVVLTWLSALPALDALLVTQSSYYVAQSLCAAASAFVAGFALGLTTSLYSGLNRAEGSQT